MQNLDKIYRDYASLIYKYLLCLCHNELEAEELTQETFYQAIRCFHTYNETCKLSTWLCQIAKHLWYQSIQKKKKNMVLEKNMIPIEENMEEIVIQKEEKIELYKKINQLEEVQKTVVLLRIRGDLSFKEIGEVLEKTENWARVTFYRAKKKIMEE